MQIIATIIPIFIIILVGWIVYHRGFLPEGFVVPANRLVYYVAMPAMIFQSVTRSNLKAWFNPRATALTLIALVGTYLFAWGVSRMMRQDRATAGTFIQSCGHGNLVYIGLAVAYYFLGEEGMARGSLIAGFMFIAQNLCSVMALQYYAPKGGKRFGPWGYLKSITRNPVILSVAAGLLVSLAGLPIPEILRRSLSIISSLALPMALLIIGASLSPERIRFFGATALATAAIKLLVMPAVGWGLYLFFKVPASDMLPGLILLASPTATVTYVLAKEMNGDSDLAVAAISVNTLLSAGTLMLWLKLSAG